MNYGKDLHRKGELNKVEAMEKLAKQIEKQTRGGLAAAFLTEGYLGFDCFAMIANEREYSNKEGFIVFDEDTQEAVFIEDNEG